MKKLPLDTFLRLRKIIARNARPLDYTMFQYLFGHGSSEDFLRVLSSYQNEDGGFGYNLECNNWNPHSSPYTTCIALDYLDVVEEPIDSVGEAIVVGILQYLASGAYMLASGWVGMQGIPSNNDYAHMPWFHFDPAKAAEADIGVTKRLSNFVLRHGDPSSPVYDKAAAWNARYQDCSRFLLEGYPDYDPVALHIKSYDPATWPSWLPLPVYFVGSPQSPYYAECAHTVATNLDTLVETLERTQDPSFPSLEDLEAYEQNTPHPDGKRWCVAEQTIGNYYWQTHFIVRDLYILKKFGRLDFQLPVS